MAKAYRLLNIYDTSDRVGRWQGHRSGDGVYSLNVHSMDELKAGLDQCISDGLIFQKALFTTHGGPGEIWLDNDALTAYRWYEKFNAGHYERLFPQRGTKLYFDGCVVADGESGWKFLEAAVRTFCRVAGGYAFGWTSSGIGIPHWVPLIGGHTEHLWGGTRYVFLTPDGSGGAYLKRFFYSTIRGLVAA